MLLIPLVLLAVMLPVPVIIWFRLARTPRRLR